MVDTDSNVPYKVKDFNIIRPRFEMNAKKKDSVNWSRVKSRKGTTISEKWKSKFRKKQIKLHHKPSECSADIRGIQT